MSTKAARLALVAAVALAAPLALHPAPAAAANKADSMMFTLDSVIFKGNQRVTTDKLNSVVGIEPGQKVNRDSIVQAFQNVVAEYGKENVGGHIQPSMTTQNGHMKVVFDISEDAPAAVVVKNPVLDHETITGNVKVSSAQLAPALTIKPGAEVTRDMVVADLNALSAVYKGAKQSVMITPKVTTLPEGHVDLNFEVNENPPKTAPK